MKLGISTFAYSWSIGKPGKLPDEPMDAFVFLFKLMAKGLKFTRINKTGDFF